ncbi:replication-relaxation family protein [Spinactinospora alkalitolerans]|nr:replication-relaxation family protein [Spinactinospora alkalitolerans]
MILCHHRLVTTSQLKRLAQPDVTYPHYLRKTLSGLRQAGLVDRVFRPAGGDCAWFTTEAGARLAEGEGAVPPRAYRMDAERAQGALQAHTLTVVETGLAFLEHARRSGYSMGPLSWTPEVAHRYRDGKRFEATHLISDAVLDYVLVKGSTSWHVHCFLEVDRATMPPLRLAQKVGAYLRHYSYIPGEDRRRTRTATRPRSYAWQNRYTWSPRLLVILAGGTEQRLKRRMDELYLRTEGLRRALDSDLPFGAGVTLLPWLKERGPRAKIFKLLHIDHDGLTDHRAGRCPMRPAAS